MLRALTGGKVQKNQGEEDGSLGAWACPAHLKFQTNLSWACPRPSSCQASVSQIYAVNKAAASRTTGTNDQRFASGLSALNLSAHHHDDPHLCLWPEYP